MQPSRARNNAACGIAPRITPMDDHRQSSGFPIVLAFLLAFLLLLGLGGGGALIWTTLRFQAAAQRAEQEAALQAQRAELQLQQAKGVAEGALADAVKTPNPAPPDPLRDLNDAFRAAYRSARQEAISSAGPVVVVSGDDLVLIRNGKRTPVTAVPPIYHELKVYDHITLAAYLLTRPGKT